MVEYFLGEYGYSPLSNGCPSSSPWIQPFAYARIGLLKGIWVSGWETSADYIPGWASGSILKMNYTYSGDQVAQIDSCLLDATTPRTETYGYDPLVRLTSASRTTANFAAAPGLLRSTERSMRGKTLWSFGPRVWFRCLSCRNAQGVLD